MAEIFDYATGASANQATPPGGLPERAAGGLVYGIVRETMARLRRWHDDTSGKLKATGSNGNYVVATVRGVDLAKGFSFSFRANHENPNAGATLSAGTVGQRPLTYADGSTIPAGAIKAGQLLHVAFDLDNNRWNTGLVPASQFAGTVTGEQLSLSGQVVGSVAFRTSTAWAATAAGTATQFLRGGANPAFVTPTGLPGTALFACRVAGNPTLTVKSGLPHTAVGSRLSTGTYSLAISPALPSGYVPMLTYHGTTKRIVRVLEDSTNSAIVFAVHSTVSVAPGVDSLSSSQVTGSGPEADLSGSQYVSVVVF